MQWLQIKSSLHPRTSSTRAVRGFERGFEQASRDNAAIGFYSGVMIHSSARLKRIYTHKINLYLLLFSAYYS